MPSSQSDRSTKGRGETSGARDPIIGIVGGGQLARMSHQAAISLDLPIRVLAASHNDSAVGAGPATDLGNPGSGPDLRRFATKCDVLTFDHELIDLATLAALESEGELVARPAAAALEFATDKAHQRRRFSAAGLPLPRHRVTEGRAETLEAVEEFGWPAVLKTARGGYDGRGVWLVESIREAEAVLDLLTADAGRAPQLVVEVAVPIQCELAVIVVRDPTGTMVTYPVTQTIQIDGICRETITPAPVEPQVAEVATTVARAAAEVVGAVGLTAVELFYDGDEVTINEVATRPHNSGHWSIEGADTSQFENHLRAVSGLPLGATSTRAPAIVSTNVLGHPDGRDPREHLATALAIPGVAVHLYGKEPRPGRKLGHVTTLSTTVDDARRRARAAVAALGEPLPEGQA